MGATHGTPCRWAPTRPTACVGLGSSRSRNRGALRHLHTRVPLRKSQPKVLGGWESPWPCTDLPSPGSSPGTGSGCGGDGRAAPTMALLGSPVLSPRGVGFTRGWQFSVPTVLLGCWDAGGGGSGLCPASSQSPWLSAVGALVLYPFPSAVQDPSPPLGSAGWLHLGQQLGTRVMLRDMGMGSHAAFLPSPPPSAASPCYRGGRVFGSGFRSPTQSSHHLPQSAHLGAGCTHVPITAWVPRAVSHIGHLLPRPGGIRSPKPMVLGGGPCPDPPGEEPREAMGARRCWEGC